MTAAAICTNLSPKKKFSLYRKEEEKKSCFPILLYSFLFLLRIKPAFSQKFSSSVPIFCVTRFWDRSAKTKKLIFPAAAPRGQLVVSSCERRKKRRKPPRQKRNGIMSTHIIQEPAASFQNIAKYLRSEIYTVPFLLPSFWTWHPLRLCPPLRDAIVL